MRFTHPQVRERIRVTTKMLAQGYTLREVGEVFGVTRHAIWLFCRKHGIENRRRYAPKAPKKSVDQTKAAAITAAKQAYWRRSA